MTRSPVARRYARALFELAQEQGQLDVVQADLAEIARHAGSPALAPLLHPHGLTSEIRVRAWRELLHNRAHALTLRFVLFLADKGRAGLLVDVIRAFEDLCYEARGIQPVEIVSARALPDEQVRGIIDRMSVRLNRTLHASTRVDPSLLGGFQVRVRDTIYDFSVNHQLDKLHRSLLTA